MLFRVSNNKLKKLCPDLFMNKTNKNHRPFSSESHRAIIIIIRIEPTILPFNNIQNDEVGVWMSCTYNSVTHRIEWLLPIGRHFYGRCMSGEPNSLLFVQTTCGRAKVKDLKIDTKIMVMIRVTSYAYNYSATANSYLLDLQVPAHYVRLVYYFHIKHGTSPK